MRETAVYDDALAMISLVPSSLVATNAEREVRRLLFLNTPTNTTCALQKLRETNVSFRRAEWHFLMGVCALRRGYIADAQAYLDQACVLCREDSTGDARNEYQALYTSLRHVFTLKRGSEEGDSGERRHCFSGIDCLDCCDCVSCCDCNSQGGVCDCCDCSDGCDCGDCCN